MPFNSLVSRNEGTAELPHAMADEVITGTIRQSTALRMAHVIRTDTRDSRIPVLTEQPDAYWVSGDAGMKSTGKFVFTHEAVVAEELAVVVPVPDAVLDDAEVPLWRQLRPLLVRAFGRRLDRAVLFGGTDRPASWTSPALVPDALAYGNTVTQSADPAADLLMAAENVSQDGYVPTGVAVRPGWQYGASARRTQALTSNPVGEDMAYALSIGGLPITVDPPTWEPNVAEAIVADWRNVIIGIRQDVRIEVFNTGVISDDTGKVLLNLMQQDTSAVRATFRVGSMLARPATDYGTAGSPVAIVQTGSPSS